MKKHLMAAACAGLCLASVRPALAAFNLQITEIWPGNAAAPNATDDWFEVTNTGDTAWVAATHGNLYFDDVPPYTSAPALMSGVSSIAPGQSVVFVAGNAAGATGFNSFWGSVVSPLPPVGSHGGQGLGTGAAGDAVSLWISLTAPGVNTIPPTIVAAYPDPTGSPGASYDVRLGQFSVVGNAANAVFKNSVPPPFDPTTASPGDATFTSVGGIALRVTEIWPGNNVNPDSSPDWFEVTNIGTTAWSSAAQGNLYYDDSSASPATAFQLTGVTTIAPGESVIFVETPSGGPPGITTFNSFWGSHVTGVQVGTYTGAGLSLSLDGDGINLWQSASPPIAGDVPFITANFPAATTFPGQSYDTSLSPAAFSVVPNSSGAVSIPRPSLPPEATIASPGRVSPLGAASVPVAGWLAALPLLALSALLRRRSR